MEEQCYNISMECAKIIYKLLIEFEKQLDNYKFDITLLDYKKWKLSDTRFYNYLQMLSDAGFIKGVKVNDGPNGMYINYSKPKITLKGIEYLVENSAMQKIANALDKATNIAGAIL